MSLESLPAGPGALFIYLWCRAEKWNASERAISPPESAEIIASAHAALAQNDAKDVSRDIATLIPVDTDSSLAACSRILHLMRCIDEKFYLIHPRVVVLSPSNGKNNSLPEWLSEIRADRVSQGYYTEQEERRLIPRGPLIRIQRAETASFADSLADRFAALAVVPATLFQEGRPISISHSVVWVDAARGVAPGPSQGREVLAYVPIAEASDDLTITPRHRDAKGFVDYRLKAGLNAAERLVQVLEQTGRLDIAIAPELVMTEDHADEIPTLLDDAINADCRLIVAGSGQTRDQQHGQPWNETQVLNGAGSVLWRQRKLWPAGIDHAKAKAYGLTDFGPSSLIYEDTASGTVLEVVDIDSLGRCVVLTCQDIESWPIATDLIKQFQPDWVFTPILDNGIDAGRWAHQRAFALSPMSHARFVVACSTSLCKLTKKPDPVCGMVVGPREKDNIGEGRCISLSPSVRGSNPEFAVLDWSTAKWQTTKIIVE